MTHSDQPECSVTGCEVFPAIKKPVSLCNGHASDIALWWMDRTFGKAEDRAGARVERDRLASEQEAAHQANRRAQEVVYYVRFPGDIIKIGTSANIPRRLAQLAVVDQSDVLATEPGGQKLEAMRHKQFRELRCKRNEYFRADPSLMNHIAMLLDHYGPPRIPTVTRRDVA